ncbi:MAG: substrate-binding domain-containing protein [Pirellulales bacterium]|nr:substrate-binding domain-containing protein [Pirellulales bacterium]
MMFIPVIGRSAGKATSSAGLGAGLVAALALFVLGCGGAPNGTSKTAETSGGRFVILINGDSPFWDALRVGMQRSAAELGVTAVMETNDGTPSGQLERLRQLASQSDIAGLALSVTDASNISIVDELRGFQKRGIPVIAVDSDVDRARFRDARTAFVGTDNLKGGRTLGQCAKTLRPDAGAYVQFVGLTGAQNAIERMDGFKTGAGEKLVERDRMGDETDRTRARENVRNAVRNHPDVNVLVGIWSYNAPAIVDVVKELGVRDRMTVVTFDAEQGAIKATADGQIDALVVQNPYEMGYQGVRLLKALADKDEAARASILPRFGQTDGDLYDTGLKVVVPDDSSKPTADVFESGIEFMKVGEFRRWLNERGLSSS